MIDSLEDYARVLGQRHIVDLVYVASAVILLYDLILTLHLEVSLVWYSRWNYTKVLYLLTRYVPFVANGLILYSHLIPGGSVAICANTFQAAGWLYLVGLDLAEGAYRFWSRVITKSNPSSHPCDSDLGMLGAEQVGWHWSCGLDFIVPSAVRDIHVQVPGFSPV